MLHPFDDISPADARALARDFASPLYLICERTLRARLMELQTALQRMTSNGVIAYSYKTNPLHGLISLLHRDGAWAEVVSGHEYQLARSLGVPAGQIVFNGPAKSDDDLAQAVADGCMLNADNLAELQRLAALGTALNRPLPVGIRLVVERCDEAWSRFGFDWHSGEAWRCIEWIHRQPGLRLAGLHCHLGTNIRDLERFRQMGQTLAEVVTQLRQKYGTELQWLDIGGGLAGISPRWDEPRSSVYPPMSAESYLQAALPALLAVAPNCRIILEPGRTLVDACGGLLMSVIGSRGERSWIVDGGINVSPTVRTYRHPLRLAAGGSADGETAVTRLLGNSCMNHDCITDQAQLPPLQQGDLLLMQGLGAYNLSRTVPFIHLRPGCALWRGAGQAAEWLRLPEQFSDSQHLERIPIPAVRTCSPNFPDDHTLNTDTKQEVEWLLKS
ncbi:alanine racemase [Pontibacterium sp.]|uniref:alanine racemase n=1 Tax=Pontibacterium sp. TaxID=2036026 RepID=UPI00356A1F7A